MESSKKRSRQNKLREKAQQKRERREQRKLEKQQVTVGPDAPVAGQETELEQEAVGADPGSETGIDLDLAEAPPIGEISHSVESAAGSHRGRHSSAKLYVGNLPRTVTDKALSDFVSSAGFEVSSVAVIRDRISGEAKGFGFVQLGEGEEANRAINRLDGREMDGRRLTVSEARPPRVDATRLRASVGERALNSRRKY